MSELIKLGNVFTRFLEVASKRPGKSYTGKPLFFGMIPKESIKTSRKTYQ